MNAKVEDLMVASVVTSMKHKTVGHIKSIMTKNGIHSVPIVNSENELEGIVTANDFVEDQSDETPVSHIMSKKVLTIPKYNGIHIAARIMRNHKIHHLVVTHEKKLVGVLSAWDLLALVEDHRFVSKNAPTASKKKSKRS
ncbi:MAG: CBS domain-containing protein [Saprospiraceae bacterium]|nr:CBS domain-containing protein [Saprospiraceae bacterium]